MNDRAANLLAPRRNGDRVTPGSAIAAVERPTRSAHSGPTGADGLQSKSVTYGAVHFPDFGENPRSLKDSLRRSMWPLPNLPRSQSLTRADRMPLHTERP